MPVRRMAPTCQRNPERFSVPSDPILESPQPPICLHSNLRRNPSLPASPMYSPKCTPSARHATGETARSAILRLLARDASYLVLLDTPLA